MRLKKENPMKLSVIITTLFISALTSFNTFASEETCGYIWSLKVDKNNNNVLILQSLKATGDRLPVFKNLTNMQYQTVLSAVSDNRWKVCITTKSSEDLTVLEIELK